MCFFGLASNLDWYLDGSNPVVFGQLVLSCLSCVMFLAIGVRNRHWIVGLRMKVYRELVGLTPVN